MDVFKILNAAGCLFLVLKAQPRHRTGEWNFKIGGKRGLEKPPSLMKKTDREERAGFGVGTIMILERWTKVWNVTSESDELYFFTKVTGLYFTIFGTMIFGFFATFN